MTDEKASRRGRNNRAKGAAFERDVAEALRELYPTAKRSIGQARTGAEVPDVQGTPYWVETGFGETVTGRGKLAQAVRDWLAADGMAAFSMPVAVTRKHREDPIVTMRFSDWLSLVRRSLGR